MWTIARNDLLRRLRSPVAIVILLLTPVVMTGLVGIIFSPGKNVLPRIPLLVADHDNGLFSRFLIQSFSAGEGGKFFEVTAVEEENGIRLINRGKGAALLVIPGDFSSRLLAGEKARLRLVRNPSQQYLPAIAEQYVSTVSVVLSGFAWVFHDELSALTFLFDFSAESLPTSDLAPVLAAAKVKMAGVQRVVSPLLVSLKKEVEKEKKKSSGGDISVFEYIFPGMAIMFLLFICQSAMEDMLAEKERGTLRRVLYSPLSENGYILGKLAGGWALGFISYWLMTALSSLLMGFRLRYWVYRVPLSLAATLFAASFFALLFALVKSRQQASAVSTPAILVFSVLGGSMIPLDQLGGSLRAVSRFTPNYWFIDGSLGILEGKFPLAAVVVLSLVALACLAAAAALLRRKLVMP